MVVTAFTGKIIAVGCGWDFLAVCDLIRWVVFGLMVHRFGSLVIIGDCAGVIFFFLENVGGIMAGGGMLI